MWSELAAAGARSTQRPARVRSSPTRLDASASGARDSVARVTWWETAVVSVSSAVVGGGLTAWTTWYVFRRQERAALAREVRALLGDFAGSLVIAVWFLHEMPSQPPTIGLPDQVSETLKRQLPPGIRSWFAADRWVRHQRQLRETLGDQPFLHVERVALAAAHLRVFPLPAGLREVIDAALDYILELSADRTKELKDKWPEVHKRFYETVQAYVADADEVMRALGRQPYPTP